MPENLEGVATDHSPAPRADVESTVPGSKFGGHFFTES